MDLIFQRDLLEFQQRQELGIVPRDGYAIPFQHIKDVLQRLTYASHERVMFGMLALTGCRICELDLMKRDGFIGGKFYWKLGKNQASTRCIELPTYYLEELRKYWETHRIKNLDIFGKKHNSFVRDFNKRLRDTLRPEWKQKAVEYTNNGLSQCYNFQLKGLRKSYSSLRYAYYWDILKDATAAMEFVAKEMKHSTKSMTCHHYLENFQILEIDRYKKLSMADILKLDIQKRL